MKTNMLCLLPAPEELSEEKQGFHCVSFKVASVLILPEDMRDEKLGLIGVSYQRPLMSYSFSDAPPQPVWFIQLFLCSGKKCHIQTSVHQTPAQDLFCTLNVCRSFLVLMAFLCTSTCFQFVSPDCRWMRFAVLVPFALRQLCCHLKRSHSSSITLTFIIPACFLLLFPIIFFEVRIFWPMNVCPSEMFLWSWIELNKFPCKTNISSSINQEPLSVNCCGFMVTGSNWTQALQCVAVGPESLLWPITAATFWLLAPAELNRLSKVTDSTTAFPAET